MMEKNIDNSGPNRSRGPLDLLIRGSFIGAYFSRMCHEAIREFEVTCYIYMIKIRLPKHESCSIPETGRRQGSYTRLYQPPSHQI
jgi:hypothetical protein